jgi:hypothetical protein
VLEILLVLGMTAGLVGGAALLAYVDWYYLFGGGIVVAALGLLLSLPTGLWYHLRLRRVLVKQGDLPRTWWLYPTRLHDRLEGDEKAWVLRPFYAGAFGMAVSIVGCLFVAYGAWRSSGT